MVTAKEWTERFETARAQGGRAIVNAILGLWYTDRDAPTGDVDALMDAYDALERAYHALWQGDFETSWRTRERVECAYNALRRELAYLALRQAFDGLPARLGRLIDDATRIGSRDPQDPVLVGALYHALHNALWEAMAK